MICHSEICICKGSNNKDQANILKKFYAKFRLQKFCMQKTTYATLSLPSFLRGPIVFQVSYGAQLFPKFFFAGSKSSQSFLRGPLFSQASCGPTFTLSFLRGPLYPKFIAGPILPKVSCGARLFPNFLAGPNCSLIFFRGPRLPQV